MPKPTSESPVITVAELDAMTDEEFVSLFPAGPAFAGMIVSLGHQHANPPKPLTCPQCLNLAEDCICGDEQCDPEELQGAQAS